MGRPTKARTNREPRNRGSSKRETTRRTTRKLNNNEGRKKKRQTKTRQRYHHTHFNELNTDTLANVLGYLTIGEINRLRLLNIAWAIAGKEAIVTKLHFRWGVTGTTFEEVTKNACNFVQDNKQIKESMRESLSLAKQRVVLCEKGEDIEIQYLPIIKERLRLENRRLYDSILFSLRLQPSTWIQRMRVFRTDRHGQKRGIGLALGKMNLKVRTSISEYIEELQQHLDELTIGPYDEIIKQDMINHVLRINTRTQMMRAKGNKYVFVDYIPKLRTGSSDGGLYNRFVRNVEDMLSGQATSIVGGGCYASPSTGLNNLSILDLRNSDISFVVPFSLVHQLYFHSFNLVRKTTKNGLFCLRGS